MVLSNLFECSSGRAPVSQPFNWKQECGIQRVSSVQPRQRWQDHYNHRRDTNKCNPDGAVVNVMTTVQIITTAAQTELPWPFISTKHIEIKRKQYFLYHDWHDPYVAVLVGFVHYLFGIFTTVAIEVVLPQTTRVIDAGRNISTVRTCRAYWLFEVWHLALPPLKTKLYFVATLPLIAAKFIWMMRRLLQDSVCHTSIKALVYDWTMFGWSICNVDLLLGPFKRVHLTWVEWVRYALFS